MNRTKPPVQIVSQTSICGLDKINYTFLGRFENLMDDVSRLNSTFNLSLEFPPAFSPGVSLSFANEDPSTLRGLYGTDLIAKVKKLYRVDFELLGYHFDGPIQEEKPQTNATELGLSTP